MKGTLIPEAAASLIPDGASLMIGGFMGVGTPERLIDAIVARGTRDLTVIANDTALPGKGIGKLISLLERRFRALFPKTARGEIFAGACIWLCTVLVSAGLPALILYGAQRVSVYLRLALESVMCWPVLAVRSLREESMRVYAALQTGSLLPRSRR